jgi:hypothetical protein
VGDESRARAQASGRGGRLAASVATADNDDVIGLGGHGDRAILGAGREQWAHPTGACGHGQSPCAARRCGRLQRWPRKGDGAGGSSLATATENRTASKAAAHPRSPAIFLAQLVGPRTRPIPNPPCRWIPFFCVLRTRIPRRRLQRGKCRNPQGLPTDGRPPTLFHVKRRPRRHTQTSTARRTDAGQMARSGDCRKR